MHVLSRQLSFPGLGSSGLISRLSLSLSRALAHTHRGKVRHKAHACTHASSPHAISPQSFQTLRGSFLSGHESNEKRDFFKKEEEETVKRPGGDKIRSADRCSTRRFFAPQRRKRGMDLSLLLHLLHHFLFPLLTLFLFSLVKPMINRIDTVPLI